jgi:hypothetical protein
MHAIVALLLTLVPLAGTFPVEGHGDGPLFDHPGVALPDKLPYPGGFFGQAETTVISIENFRFCIRVCQPDSVAYLRTPAGPVPGSDNPRAVVYMQKGAQISWTYHDTGCDLLRCTGHDIRIEDGTAHGRPIGLLAAQTDHQSLSWTIPVDTQPESIIRYFCARHGMFGMTGAFQVLPIRVLSVWYPQSPERSP